MKTLYNKVRAVEKLFKELEKETEKFKNSTNLNCKKGCSNCCKSPEVEATILEFLPFAYYAFKEGKALEYYDKFKSGSNSLVCNFYNPMDIEFNGGGCSQYIYRGLICRLFGFSAVKNKKEEKQLVTCSIIKTELFINYQEATKQINMKLKVPMMNEYYMKLRTIDYNLSERHLPINQAILKALEFVMAYYSYRKRSA